MGFISKLILGSTGPYILAGLGLLLIGGPIATGFIFRHKGYVEGGEHERLAWQKVSQKAEDDATALAAERQGRKDDAEAARNERARLYDQKTAPIHLEVQGYAKTPAGAVRCVDPDGLRIGSSAIAAANAALAEPARREP